MGLVAVLVVAALILTNAVYVAAEFAAVSVRRSRVQQLAADGNPLAKWLLPVLESPTSLDRYIAACQIGITLSSLQPGDQLPILGPIRICHPDLENTDQSGLIPALV